MTLVEHLAAAPDALRGAVYWILFINSLSLALVFTLAEARIVFAVWMATLGLTLLSFEWWGFSRALGAAYLALWTPLIFWLVIRNPADGLKQAGDVWLVAMFTSNLVAVTMGHLLIFRLLPV
ncbi:MAG: hypothetical protein KF895_10850 [Parvibaculum sp.]|nr:hypothetical protein [Parvibaculum sp.]